LKRRHVVVAVDVVIFSIVAVAVPVVVKIAIKQI
jgi:hypothetical protein